MGSQLHTYLQMHREIAECKGGDDVDHPIIRGICHKAAVYQVNKDRS
jgi:hypothetical protein